MAGVNVKMGVSGVQQFKNAMKESKAAVKTLDAELKLNEQQLKVNGDAQQYMENKTKLLQEQIRKQTEVVNQSQKALEAMSKSGVKETSVAFQNMREQSLAAQTQLSAMQAELDNVGAAGEQAANDVSAIGSQLNAIKLNASWENIAEGVDKITEKMEAAGRAAFNMGKKIVQATLSGGQWADELQTTADQWQISPEQLYRMRQTANLIDTDAETIFQARKKLITAMGKGDNKETMGAFAALGISNLSGTDENIENVFWKAGAGLMNMKDGVDQNEYALKLFGRSWEDLVPIFKAGRTAYEETMNSWTWMGDESFDKLTSMNDEQMKLETEWENFQHQFEAALAPALTEVMTIMSELMHEFNTYLSSPAGQEMLTQLGDAVSGIFDDLKEINPEEVMKKIKEGLDAIQTGLQWIIDNRQGVKTALMVIAGGFGALKLAGLAANIAQIVVAFKGLGAGGAAAGAAAGGTAAGGSGGGWLGTLLGSTAGKVVGGSAAFLGTLFGDLLRPADPHRGEASEIDPNVVPVVLEVPKGSYDNGLTEWKNAVNQNRGTDWGGTGEAVQVDHRSRMGQLPTQETFDRMTEVAGENTEAANKAKESSDKMTSAAEDLSKMPAEMYTVVESAVKNGMSSVTIILNESAVDTIGRQIGGGMGRNLMELK